jgi:hypothetical protein
MSTPVSAKTARGCPPGLDTRHKVTKAALRRMIRVEPQLFNPRRPIALPENPVQGLHVKISSNDRRLRPYLQRKGYEYLRTVKMGCRTADFLLFTYVGISHTEAST